LRQKRPGPAAMPRALQSTSWPRLLAQHSKSGQSQSHFLFFN
jgi:hypothetical protein